MLIYNQIEINDLFFFLIGRMTVTAAYFISLQYSSEIFPTVIRYDGDTRILAEKVLPLEGRHFVLGRRPFILVDKDDFFHQGDDDIFFQKCNLFFFSWLSNIILR